MNLPEIFTITIKTLKGLKVVTVFSTLSLFTNADCIKIVNPAGTEQELIINGCQARTVWSVDNTHLGWLIPIECDSTFIFKPLNNINKKEICI